MKQTKQYLESSPHSSSGILHSLSYEYELKLVSICPSWVHYGPKQICEATFPYRADINRSKNAGIKAHPRQNPVIATANITIHKSLKKKKKWTVY